MPLNSSIQSKHFKLHALAKGVFVAIAEDGGAAICNSALVDLGEQILVYDTFLTPQAALDLKKTSKEILGRIPNLVINSHYHNDHIWGNQVFNPRTQIISSDRTRDLILTAGSEEFNWYSANSAQKLESFRAQQHDTPEWERQNKLLLWIGYYEGLVEALPHLKVCLPGITFSERMTIHGSKRTAELITFDGAHTGSDTALYLPEDRIVFMSDLLFVGYHPYLADGDPIQLLKALGRLKQLDADCFIPGHGSVGTIADVKLLEDYVEHCLETAQALVESGDLSQGRIADLEIPDKYQVWDVPQFFQANITFLCERMSSVR